MPVRARSSYLPLPEKAIHLLYYGVPQPVDLSTGQRRSMRRKLGVPDGTVAAIGLVGRMEDKKGQHLLIEALHILRKQGLAAHATFIGPVMDSDYSTRLHTQVTDLGLQAMVTFYGSHDNPIEFMAAFDIVVLATEMETFGLVLIEAMRSGVAVVGSNAGGVPEIIEDGVSGLLFEPGNAADLAAKLKRYCADIELRNKIAAAGKERADRLFSLERHYQDLNHLLQAVVANPSAEKDR